MIYFNLNCSLTQFIGTFDKNWDKKVMFDPNKVVMMIAKHAEAWLWGAGWARQCIRNWNNISLFRILWSLLLVCWTCQRASCLEIVKVFMFTIIIIAGDEVNHWLWLWQSSGDNVHDRDADGGDMLVTMLHK